MTCCSRTAQLFALSALLTLGNLVAHSEDVVAEEQIPPLTRELALQILSSGGPYSYVYEFPLSFMVGPAHRGRLESGVYRQWDYMPDESFVSQLIKFEPFDTFALRTRCDIQDSMNYPERCLPYPLATNYVSLHLIGQLGLTPQFKIVERPDPARGKTVWWVGVVVGYLQKFCTPKAGKPYSEGDESCQAIVATRLVNRVTGIFGDDRRKTVEYVVQQYVTPLGEMIQKFQQMGQIGYVSVPILGSPDQFQTRAVQCAAQFLLYDDGWRLTAAKCS